VQSNAELSSFGTAFLENAGKKHILNIPGIAALFNFMIQDANGPLVR
jgi:hypothetical protein